MNAAGNIAMNICLRRTNQRRRNSFAIMSHWVAWFGLLLPLISWTAVEAQEKPAQPALKITPGKVVVPTDRMQRPWGELISLDLETRTGKFRRESNDFPAQWDPKLGIHVT